MEPKPQEEGKANTSMADALHEDQTILPDECVYLVRIGYEFDDGSFDEWARGTALLAGEKTLVTRQGLADTSSSSALAARIKKEREENYARNGVYLSNASEVEKHIKVRVADTEGQQLDIADIKIRNGLAGLNLRVAPNAKECIFAETTSPKEIMGNPVGIKMAGNLDDKAEVNIFSGIVVETPEDAEEGLYVNADMTGVSAAGAILYNAQGNVVGMIAGEGDSKPCFTVNAIETFLSTNGIKYRTSSQIAKEADAIENQDVADSIRDSEKAAAVADKTGLEASIKAAEELKKGQYTEESFAAVETALEAAKKSDENGQATQAEVNVAKKGLDDAVAALEERKSPVNAVMVIRTAGIIAGLIAVIFVIRSLIGKGVSLKGKARGGEDPEDTPARKSKKRKKKKAAEQEQYDGGDYYDDSDIDITHRTKSSKVQVSSEDRDSSLTYADEMDESRVSKLDIGGRDGTSLLSTGAYLVRKDNGNNIPITKKNFTIGKEVGKVDYAITGNTTVSRHHATIILEDGNYYIQDQNSTNHTFVDGIQIPKYTSTKIEDGTEIRLSNVAMVFREG